MKRNLTFAVLASVMLAACEKTDTAKSLDALATKSPDALIISAKSFFNNEIEQLNPHLLLQIKPV